MMFQILCFGFIAINFEEETPTLPPARRPSSSRSAQRKESVAVQTQGEAKCKEVDLIFPKETGASDPLPEQHKNIELAHEHP
jgi:hypothetical protein